MIRVYKLSPGLPPEFREVEAGLEVIIEAIREEAGCVALNVWEVSHTIVMLAPVLSREGLHPLPDTRGPVWILASNKG
jgi:hypothetical protein